MGRMAGVPGWVSRPVAACDVGVGGTQAFQPVGNRRGHGTRASCGDGAVGHHTRMEAAESVTRARSVAAGEGAHRMNPSTPRLPVHLTLLEGPRLTAAVARLAPWTTRARVALIAVAALASLAANATALSFDRHDAGLLGLLAFGFWVLAGIVLRELARAAAAARMGHEAIALRVALGPRRLPAFHVVLQPGWPQVSPDRRWRITSAGCGLQLGLAGLLALVSPVWGGTAWMLAALVTVGLVLWSALSGGRAWLDTPPALRGATVARIESRPTVPAPRRRGSARGERGLAWFLLLGFGLPGALLSAFGAWQSLVQEQRLRTARPVDAVVVATALVDRTRQRHSLTYRPVVRHRF